MDQEKTYGDELEGRKEFWKIMSQNDAGDVARALLEESDILDDTDFSRGSPQIKKKGLVKLLMAEYDRKAKGIQTSL